MSKTINISVYDLESMEKEIEELKKENKSLKERIKELEQCNINLQERLDNKEKLNEAYRKEIDMLRMRKEELDENCYGLAKENDELKKKRRFSLAEYDYIILTSTTPQIEIIKK